MPWDPGLWLPPRRRPRRPHLKLPKPSRRLNGLPRAADPLLAAAYLASLPLFALLRIDAIQRAAVTAYLGAADSAVLAGARRRRSCP